jgi:hypothetical protein
MKVKGPELAVVKVREVDTVLPHIIVTIIGEVSVSRGRIRSKRTTRT